jgi:lipopolysaccharide transport system permease protein
MFVAVFYYVFGVLRGAGGSDYVATLLVGLVLWQWIRSGIAHSSDSITHSLFLMRQIRIPAALVPLFVISTDTVKFAFVLTILLISLWIMGYPPALTWLQLPIVLVAGLLLIVGAGTLVAAWCPLFPDLKFVVETMLLLLMFLSGVFFTREEVPPAMQEWFFANPVAVILDAAREALLHHGTVNHLRVGYAIAVGGALAVGGIASARLLQRRYPKLSI